MNIPGPFVPFSVPAYKGMVAAGLVQASHAPGGQVLSKTSIPEKTKLLLWVGAGGRCQYQGCNDDLIGDFVSGNEDAKFGFIAHIVADSADGPRGDPVESPRLAKCLDNLMLTCATHHKLIDVDEVDRHSVRVLAEMKAAHEARISGLTEVQEDRASHVLIYAAKIGGNEAPVSFKQVKRDMLPERYPADGRAIQIELLGSSSQDSDPAFWETQRRELRTNFAMKVGERIQRREIGHLSVFALAPQPLLMELGRLLCDIGEADVRQLHREPKGWRWAEDRPPMALQVRRPDAVKGPPALVLALSGTVVDERVTSVLGPDAAIWSITADNPHNDIMRRREDLREFSRLVQATLNEIKAAHGEAATVAVFPALPVSAAVEVGRTWMPKADLPLAIYDQQRGSGFVLAFTLGAGAAAA